MASASLLGRYVDSEVERAEQARNQAQKQQNQDPRKGKAAGKKAREGRECRERAPYPTDERQESSVESSEAGIPANIEF